MPGDANGIFSIILIVIAVGTVLYLSYFFSRYLSNKSVRMNTASYMNVVDRLSVGQDRFIIIVELQGKYYMMSVTSSQITILKELDEFAADGDDQKAKTGGLDSFKNTFSNFLNKRK